MSYYNTAVTETQPTPTSKSEGSSTAGPRLHGESPPIALLDAALSYAKQEWPVFPIYEPTGIGKCSCGNPECGKNSGKHPRTEHGFKDATTDPATITKWWSRWPSANIGIATGPESGLMVVDIDGHEGREAIEAKVPQVLLTPTLVSTTSRGEHRFFSHPGPEVRIKSETGVLPKVDIRGDGGYVIAPPSLHESGVRYQWKEGHSPADRELAKPPAELLTFRASHQEEKKEQTSGDTTAGGQAKKIPKGKRNSTLASLAGTMRRRGMNPESIEAALLSENASNCDPPLGQDEVKRIAKSAAQWAANYEKQEEAKLATVLQKMNQTYTVVQYGSNMVIAQKIITRRTKEEDYIFLPRQTFLELHENKTVDVKTLTVMKDGETVEQTKQMNVAELWLKVENRPEKQGVLFEPGTPEIPGYLNLWRGEAVESRYSLQCAPFLNNVYVNICQRDAKLFLLALAWMANAVQNPTKKTMTAIVLRGKEGTGKGSFAREFGKLFGKHFLHVTDKQHFLGSFNSLLKGKQLVFADEVFWAGDKDQEGRLKTLITEPTILIHQKYLDPIEMDNYILLIMATNSEWAVPAGLGSRRFIVFDVGDEHKDDGDYFAKIEEDMNNGGREALLWLLKNLPLDQLPNPRKVPVTEALIDQRLRSNTELRFTHQWLAEGAPGTRQTKDGAFWIESEEIHEKYLAFAKGVGQRHNLDKPNLIKKLIQWVPCSRPKKHRVPDLRDGGEREARGWEFPSIGQARADFAKTLGGPLNWSDDDDNAPLQPKRESGIVVQPGSFGDVFIWFNEVLQAYKAGGLEAVKNLPMLKGGSSETA